MCFPRRLRCDLFITISEIYCLVLESSFEKIWTTAWCDQIHSSFQHQKCSNINTAWACKNFIGVWSYKQIHFRKHTKNLLKINLEKDPGVNKIHNIVIWKLKFPKVTCFIIWYSYIERCKADRPWKTENLCVWLASELTRIEKHRQLWRNMK